MILGIGALVANSICPYLFDDVFTSVDAQSNAALTDYHGLFMVPLLCASVAAIVLALLFHPPEVSTSDAVDD